MEQLYEDAYLASSLELPAGGSGGSGSGSPAESARAHWSANGTMRREASKPKTCQFVRPRACGTRWLSVSVLHQFTPASM